MSFTKVFSKSFSPISGITAIALPESGITKNQGLVGLSQKSVLIPVKYLRFDGFEINNASSFFGIKGLEPFQDDFHIPHLRNHNLVFWHVSCTDFR